MPWQEITQVEQRRSFVSRYLLRRERMAELCAEFGISEKTGYKWVRRFLLEGDQSLEDRSHAPHSIPHRMPAATAEYFLALRERHRTWGPRKLVAYAAANEATRRWPAASSVGALLKQAGLVRVRPRRFTKTTDASKAWAGPRPPCRTASGPRTSRVSFAWGPAHPAAFHLSRLPNLSQRIRPPLSDGHSRASTPPPRRWPVPVFVPGAMSTYLILAAHWLGPGSVAMLSE